MSDNSLKHQILSAMRLKTDDELIAIWQKNNHTEWTDSAFEIVNKLLQERHISLPEQNSPIQFEATESESSADKLLNDFQAKDGFSSLLQLVWIFCLFQIFLLVVVGGVFWIGSLIYNTKFAFEDIWFPIVFTVLAVPVYFLRKRANDELKQTRDKLSDSISKGLKQL